MKKKHEKLANFLYNRKSDSNKRKLRRDLAMIFKVYYQEPGNEVPIRERTKTMFVEAEAERYVREKLKDRNINIELVQRIQGAHLEYEQQNVDYKVLEI